MLFRSVEDITINTVSGTNFVSSVVYDRSDLYNIYENGRVVGKINASGGKTKLYAVIGNVFGGYQTKVIEVRFEDRSINRLFSTSESPRYATEVDKEGNDAPLHFAFDPFEQYSKDIVYPKIGSNIVFNQMVGGAPLIGSYTDGVSSSDRPVLVNWDDSKVRFSYKGVERNNFTYANVRYNRAGTVSADKKAYDDLFAQTKPYLVRIMDRTITGFTNLFKRSEERREGRGGGSRWSP